MTDDILLLKKRFTELAKRSTEGGYFTFTDFLGVMEQSVLWEIRQSLPQINIVAFGGCEGAERVMVRFGNPDELGYEADFPIKCIFIYPKAQKFAENLSHRDFLGSLMSLGIERTKLGDIIVRDKCAYLFAAEELTPFITEELVRVRNTDIKCQICQAIPNGDLYKTEPRQIQLSSVRLDAMLAKTFHLSRDDAQALFRRGMVFVEGRICESVSYTPRENERISVRTYGRLIYRGIDGTSRKGKLNVTVEVFV